MNCEFIVDFVYELASLDFSECVGHRRQGFGSGTEEDFVERAGVERLFRAYVGCANTALIGNLNEAGGGIDGAGGADDEEDGGAVEFAVDTVHIEGDFAEPDDVWAERCMAGFADGEAVWVFVEFAVGEVIVGPGTARLEETAVHVMDAMGTSTFVEVVYVLSAEVEVFVEMVLDLCESFVSGVGVGCESVAATLGVEAPDQSWV